ncbi:MAG: sulfotransferase [Candidatus Woykebacteria bacterium]
MYNKEPVIVNGFGRGGTNILMNLLLSHKHLAAPSGELNKVIKGGARGENKGKKWFKKLIYEYPIKLRTKQDLFDRLSLDSRYVPSESILRYIDWILYREKLKALHESKNLWKSPELYYTKKELKQARLTFKAHNGLIFLNDMFREMYPDAKFICIVRNGLSVIEGQMRRGRPLTEMANLYNEVGKLMLKNSNNEDYLIVRFEDIIEKPLKMINQIFEHCGLDISDCEHFRLQHKSLVGKNGKTKFKGAYDRQLVWYTKNELENHFDTSVNKNQLNRLHEEDLKKIKDIVGDTLLKLGYSYSELKISD